ncbi:glycine--tRNA ligase subunit beta [Pectinatus cerevisiiphilus]|uniref:Glycine--tRNA ligase beta subunit n=1 Tax=Pectinatus cerevisiiphilus TaxID=86956 RepID=A0A4R3K6Z3_9FIRM|nr:glycine--tRNA ligase subunit beta [Pectinatus cerevisiiphilus]TCS78706.1 glycyl-tRNA synthetase beta chain [Pectinatus cerevisiiphilus]
MSKDLLLEIGTEEIPAHFMPAILKQLKEKAEAKFSELHIDFAEVKTYGTPRRIALFIKELAKKQADISTEHKGPSIKIAFDADNKPTKAAIGFARGKNIAVDQLTVKDGYVYAAVHEQGQRTVELLPSILPQLIEDLSFPKNMRWGNLDFRFVRPIRWIVALLGDEIIPFTIANVHSGNKTRGHRFLSDGTHVIENASDYKKAMKKLFIVVDQNKRRDMIKEQINALAAKNNGHAQITEDLLEEVTYLVEYPTALCGKFEEKYLKLPKEAVITPMREHQRYFPVIDDAGNLLPLFITIRNGGDKALSTVQHGNERVLRARLADAQFFFDEDRKKKLVDYLEKLKTVVFQEGLGSVYDKALRLQKLTEYLAAVCEIAPSVERSAKRAALLAKADLVTAMVCEFTELQGIMGREYALLDGEDESVAKAIDEHYMPRFAGDKLPSTVPGQLVSLADKMDTITATFSRGLIPTGSQDPFALRRQALGIVNTLISAKMNISLNAFIEKTMELLSISADKQNALAASIIEFIKLRLKNVLTEAAIRYDIVDSVLGDIDNVYAVYEKALALNNKLKTEDLTGAIQSFVRVGNIAKQNLFTIDKTLFSVPEEKALYQSYLDVKNELQALGNDYNTIIDKLATLSTPIDNFFNKVMVMDKDEKIKNNRLALLKNIDKLIKTIADFNKIVL